MTTDSVTLAAAWRKRVAAGRATHGVTVEYRPDKATVRYQGARSATFTARYQADAYAELFVRRVKQHSKARQENKP